MRLEEAIEHFEEERIVFAHKIIAASGCSLINEGDIMRVNERVQNLRESTEEGDVRQTERHGERQASQS